MTQPPQNPYPNMYGYNPMYPPPPQIQYPKGYWVKPDMANAPIEEIPPAHGNVIQAWLSIGVRITRKNIARWSNVEQPSWTLISLLVYFLLPIIGFIFIEIVTFQPLYDFLGQIVFIINKNNINGTGPILPTGNTLHAFMIYEYISIIVYLLITNIGVFFVLALYLAGVADARLGTFKERYGRAIRPLALAFAPVGILQFFLFVFGGIGFLLINNAGAFTYIVNLSGSANPDFSQVFAYIAIGMLAYLPIAILTDAYIIAHLVQGGNVGTGVNRWGVFGLSLAAGVTVGIVVEIFGSILNVIVRALLLK